MREWDECKPWPQTVGEAPAVRLADVVRGISSMGALMAGYGVTLALRGRGQRTSGSARSGALSATRVRPA